MAEFKPIYERGGVSKNFAAEDGRHYRHFSQDIDPIMRHVEHMRVKANEAPRTGNKHGWKHLGTIPMTVLQEWLKNNNYGIDEFARAERNDVYGPKYKFLKYFMSRDFSKLHNDHVTTKKESSHIWMPGDPK